MRFGGNQRHDEVIRKKGPHESSHSVSSQLVVPMVTELVPDSDDGLIILVMTKMIKMERMEMAAALIIFE